jgi:hypothetical protein
VGADYKEFNMNENVPLDELLLRGTGIGAELPERTWQERMEFTSKKWYVDEETLDDRGKRIKSLDKELLYGAPSRETNIRDFMMRAEASGILTRIKEPGPLPIVRTPGAPGSEGYTSVRKGNGEA